MERRVAVLIVFAVGVSSLHAVDHTLDSVWEDWKSLHGKEYTQDSEGQRRMIWEENHCFIQQHNLEEAQGKHSYKLGMNQFGDLVRMLYLYIRDKGGIASESSYPYTAKDTMLCRYSKSQRAASCKGYKILPEGENALRKALVYVGPISVSVNSSLHTFKFYESGIYFHRECSKSPDHALLAVGYGKSIDEHDTSSRAKHPSKFWILKNSWGTRWGEGGYMRLARDRRNHCGIGIFSVYPEV
ncbi:hypothetical protein JZ751_028245 [Albula glossodonta]|uniref:Uncharacterized protein n=1 Tax=Albula glossodonta TaxID=121402 RepID=A0A8T2NJF3_9TELE|nr:hypothetical protein JZ751_028245 [Albula glossodonta]